MSRVESRESRVEVASHVSRFTSHAVRAFTMIEIALCLAIIGFALLAIIIVLPYGMGTQRDNRQETLIGQDANLLIDLVRSGSRGADDLTNYVYAITNYWTFTNFATQAGNSGVNGYTYEAANGQPPGPANIGYPFSFYPINTGSNIISLLSTPEFTDANGLPVRKLDSAFVVSGYSNHVVAYVRSISGLVAEKPPQDNSIMREDSFAYRLFIVNAPLDFAVPPLWLAQNYNVGDAVAYRFNTGATYWRAIATGNPGPPATPPGPSDVPGSSGKWVRESNYNHEAAGTQRELRLTFLWPQLPNGKLGSGRQIFRASVGGQIGQIISDSVNVRSLYFYQPQSFSPQP